MQVVEWLLNHPVILLGSSVALWLVSLIAVMFSPKFRRKFWWGLCCFVSFAWEFRTADTITIVGFPAGAALVLAIALLGPKPKTKTSTG